MGMLKEISVKNLFFNKSTRLFFVLFFIFCFIGLWQIKIAHSQTQKTFKEAPLHVESDKMIAQKNTSMIEFIGNVKVTKADSIVFADSIQIYFMDDNKNKDAQNNIKKIVSTGNVKYIAGERKAFADKAVYTTQDGILVLTGKAPKLITGSSFVTGTKITLFRNQDKVLVESDGTKRVEALFNPEDNITEKQ
ncbi:lipopolysaccharide export system protein LptA [Desulfobacula phenolica]|uniref:Lipopolysaccharide export system protein LptA n=1 Tax=Desulfobacula phenolica TaxID=90732 RepID=A0A1H2EW16_9BACT|nr:lipopolysaccharide export system protein LptA [Desulfobacula phenolica]